MALRWRPTAAGLIRTRALAVPLLLIHAFQASHPGRCQRPEAQLTILSLVLARETVASRESSDLGSLGGENHVQLTLPGARGGSLAIDLCELPVGIRQADIGHWRRCATV